MTAIVPDTLQGALIISVIDFFLSFLIISGIGVVLAFFPLLNRAALIFKAAPSHTGHGHKAGQLGKAARDSNAEALIEEDIAAVMAAVVVVMGGSAHRILSVQPASKAAWSAQGRSAQHGSHAVR